ncbi:Fur family transcriptional regulator [Pumilibacter muris]|uniref:Fur family transcriptional regulator n=1 Tax=Pumilibacter muris TaxID=2941510 RepID=UPI00203F9A94|nr:transcriptional repressor [Pumilibacter muris]
MRYSSRREAILEVLRNTKEHPDADTVYEKVREKIPNISLGTVYRNLRELGESGELNTLETEDGSTHFDADTSRHAHFVCKGCGKIGDLFGYGDVADALEHAGYKVECVKTVVYGLCPECARKQKDCDPSLS